MARFTGATLSVLAGLAGTLVVAGAVATGCGGDDNGGTTTGTTTTSHTTTTTTSSGTTTSTSSTSATSTPPGDAGDAGADADATVPPCNTAAVLGIDAGQILFSFNDGGTSVTIGTQSVSWTASVAQNDLDAAFAVTGQGNPTVGNSCPGSFEMVVPFSTTGQKAAGVVTYPTPPGVPLNAKAIHLALRYELTNTDAGVGELTSIGQDGGGGYVQAYAQWGLPGPDGGVPDSGFFANNNFPSTGWNNLPTDGGWLAFSVPITVTDPDSGAKTAATTDVPIFLSQIAVQVADPQFGPEGGPVALPTPVTVHFFVDDVWFE
jgi:hypothetical protein